MKRLFKDYGLSITLFVLFILSWLGQFGFQWKEYQNTQKDHNQPVEMSGFLTKFGQSTLENWQSEFLQLLTMVILTAHLSHKGSPESKDSEEKTEKMLKEILANVKTAKL